MNDEIFQKISLSTENEDLEPSLFLGKMFFCERKLTDGCNSSTVSSRRLSRVLPERFNQENEEYLRLGEERARLTRRSQSLHRLDAE